MMSLRSGKVNQIGLMSPPSVAPVRGLPPSPLLRPLDLSSDPVSASGESSSRPVSPAPMASIPVATSSDVAPPVVSPFPSSESFRFQRSLAGIHSSKDVPVFRDTRKFSAWMADFRRFLAIHGLHDVLLPPPRQSALFSALPSAVRTSCALAVFNAMLLAMQDSDSAPDIKLWASSFRSTPPGGCHC
jgi:hypothetical protein